MRPLGSGSSTTPGITLAVTLALALAGCGTTAPGNGDAHSRTPSAAASTTASADPEPARSPRARRRTRFVLAISVDGLNVRALKKLGRRGTPHFHRLIRQGSSTLNARTEYERTITLPNHTGMLTGRRVNRNHGGHGVTFNTDIGGTVHDAAGHRVSSVFNVVHAQGRRTALFTSKPKFALFRRSWPGSIGRYTVRQDNAALVRAVRADLRRRPRAFTFLHLSAPDRAGHRHGFMSRAYLRAVRRTDHRLGELLRTIKRQHLRRLTIVLTADHGGHRRHGHGDRDRLVNYRVPFIVWGAGVTKGANLYRINPAFDSPGRRRPGYSAARTPIRNSMVANLSTTLLRMPAVSGSEFDARQRLRVQP